ncbi:hypothetical protein C4D60_Mb03t07740 [Musa balbisiana]|uniref:Uncharacterized protein n=1 Tax=Musa balbisiana TaxID=52838 RepID=A0A4S8JA07_MUSBA|nr:hypothetical protein C4D60_Mb03t07740 [Musa balbisiana]
MGRRPCCSKEGLNRGAWSAREDNILVDYIRTHGEGKWRDLPKRAGLKRCGKSCRLRWLNYLRPDIKRGNITQDEEDLIIKLHALLGNRWSLIAGRLPGRTDNEIKNYWNTNLSKKTMPPLCTKGSSKGKEEKKVGSEEEEVKAAGKQLPGHVIQTKAVRCTKVYLPSPRDDPLTTGHSSELTHGESPSSSVPRDADPASFLEEFDMDEFMSSFQEDGLLQLCVDEALGDANYAREDADDDSLWFCDPMHLDLSDGNTCTESQVAAEVERLTYLIDCEEEAQDK